MTRHRTWKFSRPPQIILTAVCLMGLVAAASADNVTVFATGLNNPRGLKFGPDGCLYVAEGGDGGLNPGTGIQVVGPVGPYTGSVTGSRISRIEPDGHRTTLIDNLPSSQSAGPGSPNVSGVADIAFIGDTLYALFTGAGASHGVPTIPNGVVRVNADGTYTMIADLSAYYATHPVANPSPNDFEPDGVPYSLLAKGNHLYVIEPNRGSFDKVNLDGTITRVLDTSVNFGTVYVPTVMVQHKGTFYLGNLGSFMAGGANVLQVDRHGNATVLYSGFTDILGIERDQSGRFYVLETSTGDMGPMPMTGDIIRIGLDGHQKVIASGLFFPTGMTLGPDGNLYVSNVGFGPPANGLGQVLKVTLP